MKGKVKKKKNKNVQLTGYLVYSRKFGYISGYPANFVLYILTGVSDGFQREQGEKKETRCFSPPRGTYISPWYLYKNIRGVQNILRSYDVKKVFSEKIGCYDSIDVTKCLNKSKCLIYSHMWNVKYGNQINMFIYCN